MFSRCLTAVLALAVATNAAYLDERGAGDCNVGELYCCDNAIAGSGNTQTNSVGLLNGILNGVVPMVPLTCIPISALVGLGTINCNAQTVCCEDSNFNGINLLSCTPLNVAV